MHKLVRVLIAVSFALTQAAIANTELDHKYSMETVGFLRSWDNVDGLFAEYVSHAYQDYFSKQSRFISQDLSKADDLLSKSKIPYVKLIADPKVLAQLARATRTELIVRTKIQKEGFEYRFTLELLHAPEMDLLTTYNYTLIENNTQQSPEGGTQNAENQFGLKDLSSSLEKGLDELFKKLPFLATVTGRDNESVTVNIGANVGLKKGDVLLAATLDEVKKHPLLKTIVDWRFAQTGRLEVDSVDDRIAFCKITEEEKTTPVARGQKITRILPFTPPPVETESLSETTKADDTPRLGFVSATIGMGGLSRETSTGPAAVPLISKSGGGVSIDGIVEAQIWLTRDFFGELALGHGVSGYSQKNLDGSGTPFSASPSISHFAIDLGYNYFASNDFFGPKGWVKFGFRSTSYSFPSNNEELLGDVSFKSGFIGLGAELPIRSGYGAYVSLEFGLLASGSQVGLDTLGTLNSASDYSFSAGAYYRYTTRIGFRAGFQVLGNSAQYSSNANMTQKLITFTPSLLYYF